MVAELVLQALDVKRVAAAVGQDARQQEAGQAAPSVWASTRKKSDIGAEQNHLWPTSSYSAPAPPPFSGSRDGGVGAHVRAALLLGHRHARDRRALLAGRDQARVIAWWRSPAAPTRPPARAGRAARARPRRSS